MVLDDFGDNAKKFTVKDIEILSKPTKCPACGYEDLYEKRFWQADLPKEFMNAQYQFLLENLSGEALYEAQRVIFWLGTMIQERYFKPRFIIKSAQLGCKAAMVELITIYERGRYVNRNLLRAIAWAKRRYNFEKGEGKATFERLLNKYNERQPHIDIKYNVPSKIYLKKIN